MSSKSNIEEATPTAATTGAGADEGGGPDHAVTAVEEDHPEDETPATEGDAVVVEPVAATANTTATSNPAMVGTTNNPTSNTPPGKNFDGSVWKNPLRGWNNMPATRAKVNGSEVTMRIPPRSDCWRKTRNNFNRDNAPYHWHKVTGDFEVFCKIAGDLISMYDKAGMMIRLDEANWIMTGMEFFNNQMNHSTCVTKDHTDWSLTPIPLNAEKVGIWFKYKRLGDSFECFFSKDDMQSWIMTREGIFTSEPTLYVGICGASPIGKGFKASYSMYRCLLIKRKHG